MAKSEIVLLQECLQTLVSVAALNAQVRPNVICFYFLQGEF